MSNLTLISTFFLTLLLTVGLFFFIRASVKDRTEKERFISQSSKISLIEQIKSYFENRSYQIISNKEDEIIFEGTVRPSWFLAIFLSILSSIGLLCFGLILSFLYQPLTPGFLSLVILSPITGLLYWKKACKLEKIFIHFESHAEKILEKSNCFTLTGHRDEIAKFKKTFPLQLSN